MPLSKMLDVESEAIRKAIDALDMSQAAGALCKEYPNGISISQMQDPAFTEAVHNAVRDIVEPDDAFDVEVMEDTADGPVLEGFQDNMDDAGAASEDVAGSVNGQADAQQG